MASGEVRNLQSQPYFVVDTLFVTCVCVKYLAYAFLHLIFCIVCVRRRTNAGLTLGPVNT